MVPACVAIRGQQGTKFVGASLLSPGGWMEKYDEMKERRGEEIMN